PPLELAVKHNEIVMVKRLLGMGASGDMKTAEGYTLAELAVYSGYPEVLQALLDHGARIEKNFGVLWAIRDGKGKSVGVLLDHGANPNVLSENGDSALWLAASAGQVEATGALIAHKAVIDYPNKAQSMTALAIAAHSGQLDTVKMLVEAHANLESKDGYGMTP